MVKCLREWRNERKRMTRNGKIARLPAAIREQLNQRLLEGEPGKPLVEWLNGLPRVRALLAAQFQGQPIVAQNLSRWKQAFNYPQVWLPNRKPR
jgi:hypothetical protein